MITNEEAEKKFNSNDVMEAEPAGIRRVIMPAYGFAGASPQKKTGMGRRRTFYGRCTGL